jgi:hypothetical protein
VILYFIGASLSGIRFGGNIMRISVPTLPHTISSFVPPLNFTPAYAIERIAQFLKLGNVAVLTGAGVSVDSGIRAYRGKKGRYINPNYKCAQNSSLHSPRAQTVESIDQYWYSFFLLAPTSSQLTDNQYHDLIDEKEKGFAFRYDCRGVGSAFKYATDAHLLQTTILASVLDNLWNGLNLISGQASFLFGLPSDP